MHHVIILSGNTREGEIIKNKGIYQDLFPLEF